MRGHANRGACPMNDPDSQFGTSGAMAPSESVAPKAATPNPSGPGMPRIMQRAMLWNLLNVVVQQGAGFVIFLIIAARVPPHIFGIIALASLAADFVSMEGRYAAMDAILQANRYDRRSLDSAFTAFLSVAIVLATVLWAAAPSIGAAFHDPMVATFVPLFGLMLIPIPWLAVMDALMMRDLRYRQVTERNIAATLISGAIGIGLAFTPWLVWALFAQRLASLIVVVALEYRFTRWLPKLHFDPAAGLDFIRRFLALWVVGTLVITINRATTLIFGIRYDLVTVGLLRATNRISESIQGPIISPLTGLWFPLMAKAKGNLDGEREIYNNILRTAAFVALPTFAGLAIVAGDIVSVILPTQYAGVTPILRATAVTLLLIPVLWYNNVAMTSMGMNKSSLVYTGVLVVSSLVTLLAFARVSPPAALLIMAVPCAIVGIVGNVLLNRRLRQTNLAHYSGLLPAILATAAMSAVTSLVADILAGWPAAPRLIGCVATGAIVYGGWLSLFHRAWLMDRIQLLRGRERAAGAG